jgi:hypothetical protein
MGIAQKIFEEVDEPSIIASDFSPQSLWSEFADRRGQSSVLFRDEVSGFFNSMRRHSYMAGMKAVLIKLFDGDNFTRRLRKERITVEKPFFTWLCGAVTEKLLESVTEDDVFSGFLIRFILLNPEQRGPTRPLQYERDYMEGRRDDRLEVPWSISAGETVLSVEKGSPYSFYLDPLAKEHFDAYVGRLEKEGLEDPITEKINGRVGPLTLKLMVLFAADHPDHTTRRLSRVMVGKDLLIKSIYWSEIFRSHMLRTLGGVSQSQRERKTDRVVEFITRNPGTTRGKIMRRFKFISREMDEVRNTLVERGLIKLSIRTSSTRPAETYWPISRKEKQQ